MSGMAKLIVMCAGIGSPGTLAAVFGGYLGSKYNDPVFKEAGPCTHGALSPSLNQSLAHLALSRPLSTNQLYTWRYLALSQPISCTRGALSPSLNQSVVLPGRTHRGPTTTTPPSAR